MSVEGIEAPVVFQEKKNRNANADGDAEPEHIDDRDRFLRPDVAPGKEDIAENHSTALIILIMEAIVRFSRF